MSENQLKLLLAARELHMNLLNDRIMALQRALDDALLANEALEAALIEKNAELAEYRDLVGTHKPLDSLFPGDSQRLVALMIKGKFQ